MRFRQTAVHLQRYAVLIAALLVCSSAAVENNVADQVSRTGRIVYAFAGDLFTYELETQSISMIAERKGRQGPFFSPDGGFFSTNNWPGSNDGVAVWDIESGRIVNEFVLPNTLISDDKGVKVAPGAALFSGILNAKAGGTQDLVVMNEKGAIVHRFNGRLIRIKGHTWDTNQHLYFTGEIQQGNQQGVRIMAKVTDLQTSNITLIRTFDGGSFADIPDELSVSNDGAHIVYAYKRQIWVGSTAEYATDHRARFQSIQSLGRPVFSPDGAAIAMVMLNSDRSHRGAIHIADLSGEGITDLDPDGATQLPGPNSERKSTWTSGQDSSLGWLK